MNILFYLKSFGVGGIEVVTMTLAETMTAKGHNVSIFAFTEGDQVLKKRLPKGIKLYIGHGYKASSENVTMVRHILVTNHIQVVVNQWGLPFLPIRVVNKARKGLHVKVISVYHSQVNANGRITAVRLEMQRTQSVLKNMLLNLKLKACQWVTSASMRYVYRHSDLYEVLSPSFVQLFEEFTGIRNPRKLVVQTNPVTVASGAFVYGNKLKEIIYVGRLESVVKRVYRVIDTWAKLETRFPDWRLTIVGDGEDRCGLEQRVKELGLQRVSFEGFQQPKPYYERASILMLTSEYEGFPLVLAECMSFGVIPAVYNSYSAVRDIITDGKDGIVIPYHADGYQVDEAALLLSGIMEDEGKRKAMALAAIEKSRDYSVERIYEEWKRTFQKLNLTH